MGIGILGTGSYVPDHRVTNEDLVRQGLRTTNEWIIEHTGIYERRIVRSDQATSDLAAAAGARAVQAAGLEPSDIDLIVCATSTPDHLLPSTASLVQHKLGCSGGAFDVNSSCSGFAYAVAVGFAMSKTPGCDRVLVIGADTYSRIVDWSDRSTAVFFGDGAGAVVLGPCDDPDWLLSSTHGSDGSMANLIMVPAGGSRDPTTEEVVRARANKFRMDGRAVWDFVARRVPQVLHAVTSKVGLRLSDVDWLIPHQANRRLLEDALMPLEYPMERVYFNMQRYGNTAAASVGVALDEAVRSKRVRPGDTVVVLGFGGGLAWSASCMRWGATTNVGKQP